jgi:GNAT superfamily N-acetyltransferase
LWADGGIGAGRLAVMDRVCRPKTALLARSGDRPGAVAFVAVDGDIAMLHALEVSPAARRRGIGRRVMEAAASWAVANGANWLSVMVTKANLPANALYQSLCMQEVTTYHYRRATEAST